MTHVMKNMTTLLLVFATTVASSACSQENQWDVEIALDKRVYILHEPIWLDVTATNNTSDALRTQPLGEPNDGPFTIELYDEDGDLVEYTGPSYSVGSGPGELLSAGEQEYKSFNLNWLFAQHGEFSGYKVLKDRFPFIPKGMYTVQVVFEECISNVLTFKIVEPTGDDRVVLRLIEEAFAVLVGSRLNDVHKKDLSSIEYAKIVERFPNSVLAETCYYLSRFYSRERWELRKQGLYDKTILKREMLDRFPNSGNSGSWLRAVTRGKDDSTKAALLEGVATAKPDTRAAKYAKLMLKTISNQKAGE